MQELVLPAIIEDGAGSRKGPPTVLLLDSDINLLIHAYALMSLDVPGSRIDMVNNSNNELKTRYIDSPALCPS